MNQEMMKVLVWIGGVAGIAAGLVLVGEPVAAGIILIVCSVASVIIAGLFS